MDRAKVVIILIVLLIGILSVWRIMLSNSLTTQGIALYRQERQATQLVLENSYLRERILHDSSLSVIRDKAYEAGFIEATRNDYLYLKGR